MNENNTNISLAVSLIGMLMLLGCHPSSNEGHPGGARPGQNVEPSLVSRLAAKRPPIWQGKIFYDGNDVGTPLLNSMNELLGLYSDQELQGIKEISWASCSFTRIEGLGRLPNLRTLDLLGNRITIISDLDEVPLLEVINLSRNRIEAIEGLEGLPNLRELYLVGNYISSIKGLERLAKLEVLMLEGNKIAEVSGLTNLRSLRRLGLAGNRLRDLRGLQELESLEEVSIESTDNQLDESAMQFIRDWNKKHAGKPGLQLRSGMPGRED